jgi:hypothetical protein
MDIVAKWACAALLLATGVGMMSCAKAYQMPPETLAFRQTLDDTRALALVNDLIRSCGSLQRLRPGRVTVTVPVDGLRPENVDAFGEVVNWLRQRS